jgi:hypothetical protein
MILVWLSNLGMGGSAALPSDLHGHATLGYSVAIITISYTVLYSASTLEQI